MKKITLIFLILSLILGGTALSETCKVLRLPKNLEPGKTRSQVRKVAGLPVQMKGNIWKYKEFVVIFESNAVKCIVKSSCFGKWSNCHSYKLRSPDCVLSSD